jgi:hypothetical protein
MPVPHGILRITAMEAVQQYVVREVQSVDRSQRVEIDDGHIKMFGEKVTPNHHKLAEEFVLLDNPYCNGQVSRDGHPWSTMAYNTDYIARGGHLTYSGLKGVDDDDEAGRGPHDRHGPGDVHAAGPGDQHRPGPRPVRRARVARPALEGDGHLRGRGRRPERPDHVDAHRPVGLVISPYSLRGKAVGAEGLQRVRPGGRLRAQRDVVAEHQGRRPAAAAGRPAGHRRAAVKPLAAWNPLPIRQRLGVPRGRPRCRAR